MKIKKILGPIVLASLTSLTANAAIFDKSTSTTDFYYADIKAGMIAPSTIQGNSDLQSVTPNTSYTAGFALGRKFMDRFGAELQYMYRGKSDINSSSAGTTGNNSVSNKWSVSANTFMFNMTADMLTGSMIRPYVKLGAGLSMNKSGQYSYTTSSGGASTTRSWNGKTSSHFAWQAGFGLAMATSDAIETKIEYAFVDRGEFKTGSNMTTTTSASSYTTTSQNKTGKLREQVITLGIGCKF